MFSLLKDSLHNEHATKYNEDEDNTEYVLNNE